MVVVFFLLGCGLGYPVMVFAKNRGPIPWLLIPMIAYRYNHTAYAKHTLFICWVNYFVFISVILNINLLKQKYNNQSEISLKKYKIDLNSRKIFTADKFLKLTEKEIEIILFLNSQNKSKNIQDLQKEVWGYISDLETHTVETHIYRLRKKIKENFNDENFIISSKAGYHLNE